MSMTNNKKRFNILRLALCLVAFCSVGNLFLDNEASALYDWNSCMSSSGGREHISSVKWVCNQIANAPAVNTCSLWLGPANNSTTVDFEIPSSEIQTNSRGEKTATIAYWGMCTYATNETDPLWVNNDNNSIDDGNNLNRGLWGSPNKVNTTLNVDRFIDGATIVSQTSTKTKYGRTVTIGRCHGGNPNSCSEMDEDIIITIENTILCDPATDCCPGEEGYPNCPPPCDPATDCCPGEEGYPNCPIPCNPATDCCPGEECYETGCVCYCGEDTSVTVKQKNSSSKIPSYSSWTVNKIYAKPTDKINYTYTYCAGVQFHASDTVTTKHGSHECEDTSNTNKDFSDAITWNNYYKVSAPHSYSRTFTYNVGDVTDASSEHSFNVEGSDVGKVLDSTITSSTPISASSSDDGIHTWSKVCSKDCACNNANPETGAADTMDCACPAESFSHDNNYYSKSYTSGPDSESVDVRIPYNYRIDNGKVNIKTDIFFAGETFTLTDAKIDVMTAYSETLKETYATKTQSAKISLYSYYVTPSGSKSSAVLMDSKDVSSMNSSSNLKGSTETFFSGKTYSIYDIPAGSNMCLYLVSSIGKSSSNPDSNAAEGTYTSPTVCKVIYKKPSFQIWGGSLYTGSSNLKTAYKTNVSGYYSYGPNNTDKNTTFGSWVEYAVVYGKDQGSAAATGIASGASSSYSKDSKKPGGSLEPTSAKYCKRAPLTISNVSCASDKITKSGITTSSSVLNSIYGLFIDGHSLKATSNNANLSNTSTYNEDKHIRYTSVTNNTNISASGSLPVGITHVVYSNGTINITSNLTYENTPLTSISQMPQYIIYAKNINIACNVTRIDGWVIAKDGTIKTCSDGGDDNSSARSKQLIINGPVIAKSVVFGRTYGAASGKNSVVPAEIFNMTPMTNLWSEAGASNTPTLHSQYIRELAPRY